MNKKYQFYDGQLCPNCKVGHIVIYFGGRFQCPLCPAWDEIGKLKPRKKLTEKEFIDLYNNFSSNAGGSSPSKYESIMGRRVR